MIELRRIVLWLLLLPLALTVVPRGMLHHCVHGAVADVHTDAGPEGTGADCPGHTEDQASDRHRTSVQADCPVCDVHVLVGVFGSVQPKLVVEATAPPHTVALVSALHNAPHPAPGDRGPPARV